MASSIAWCSVYGFDPTPAADAIRLVGSTETPRHRREVDHYSVITDGLARDVVAPATNGDRQVVLAGEAERRAHVIKGQPTPLR